jgi:hypothetical protein
MYFHTKNANCGTFWDASGRKIGVFNGNLVFLMAIWHIFPHSGLLYVCTKKNLATLAGSLFTLRRTDFDQSVFQFKL